MATFPVDNMLGESWIPKRSNNWTFQFADESIPAFTAKTFSRPSFSNNPITIDYMNTKRYLAGKFEWNTIRVGLYDPIAPSSAQRVMEWVRLSYENLSGRAGYPAFYKKNISLKMLDTVGALVEQWEIEGCFIQDATFGDLDYSNAEAITVEITLRPDRCILKF